MAKTNKSITKTPIFTHEGAKASHINAEQELRRSVMACMLWEDSFYEDGIGIAERIKSLIPKVKAEAVAIMAVEARSKMKLRHVPLLIVREMARYATHRPFVASTLVQIIQRPDELTEFLSIYWIDGKTAISAQVKKGLALAFRTFNAYQLAKYNRDEIIKLRDVMFLTHPKPINDAQAETWKKLVEGTLESPDTWEVELSAGKDKKATFERLISENKLGALAFLRNLRNIQQAGISQSTVERYSKTVNVERVLPFRFISVANAVPMWEPILEPMMFKCLEGREKFNGATALLVDHSRSMETAVSAKSDISCFDAASAIGMLLRETCDEFRVFTFSNSCIEVPARRGFALREAIKSRINPVGTLLGMAVKHVYKEYPQCQRLIVVTDEQSADTPPNPQGKGYVINVGTDRNGIGYGAWTHISGWSEAVLDYIQTSEAE